MPIKLSNPRLLVEIPDYPLGGDKRGLCVFAVHRHKKKGYRVSKQTFGKPKYTTYSGQCCIVDGEDGRTYILSNSKFGGMVSVWRSDFKMASDVCPNGTAHESSDPELYADYLKLIVNSNAVLMQADEGD